MPGVQVGADGQWYQITVDGVSHTVFVEEASAPPPPPPQGAPSAPTGLHVVSVTSTTIDLDWNDSLDLRAGDKYQIYMNDVLTVPDLTASAYTVTGLAAGTAYQFRVGAGKSGDYGPWSPVVSGSTSGVQPPPALPVAPTGLVVSSVTSTTVSLDWDNSLDLRSGDKYQIYVNDSWPAGQPESTTSAYTVTGLTAGLTYQFRVSAGQVGSYGPWCPAVPGTTTGTPPPPTGNAINRPGNPMLIAFSESVTPTAAVKAAWSKPGALIIAGRRNFGDQWLKDCAAGGATIIAYLHPHLTNIIGRYAEKLYLASEFGAAVPGWPGGPYVVDEYGNLGDFRVGSLLNAKLPGVLNLMLDENPHLAGFFLDGLGTRAYPGAGGFDWNAFPMKTEYRNGAIAQVQIARGICDARNAMVIANGFWQGGFANGGGYPDVNLNGCSLLDGQMIENQPPTPNGFHHQYCVGPTAQWGLGVPRIAAMAVPRGYMVFVNPTAAVRDAWVALNAGSHYQASADYSTLDMPWRSFTNFNMPNRAAPAPPALPVAPTGLAVSSVTSTTVSLDWNDSTDLRPGDKYQIYVNDVLTVSDLTTSAYTAAGLAAGTAYQFRVSAGQVGSYGPWSAAVPGTTTSLGTFVTRDSVTGNLMLSGQRFRFSGVNTANIGYTGATPGGAYGATVDSAGMHNATHSEIDATLANAVSMNARVIRPWCAVMNVGRVGSIQPTIGSFNATALEPVDYLLQRCNTLGIKCIFPLVDNYDYGPRGIDWYVANTGGGARSNFWTRTTTVNAFKAHITYVLNHVNPYTGVALKNDPAVLAWETGNELSSAGTVTSAQWLTWMSDISTHVKTALGAQQLFFDGAYGVTEDAGSDAYLSLPLVDGYTDHTYDNGRDPAYLVDEGARVHAYGKAFFIGEYTWTGSAFGSGLTWSLADLLATIKGATQIDGDLAWSLGAPLHDIDEFGIKVPGTDANMRKRVNMLTDHAADVATRTASMPQVCFAATEYSAAGSVNRWAFLTSDWWWPEKDDLIVLFGAANSVATVAAAPAGWTNPLGAGGAVSSDSNTFTVFYHWVTAAEQEAGTRDWTVPMFTTSKTGECHSVVLRGVDRSNPVDSFNTAFSSTDTATPHVLPSLTGSNLSDNSIVLASTVTNSPTYSVDPETQWSLLRKSGVVQGQWTGVANKLATAGVTVPAANITPTAGDEYASIAIAFNATPVVSETAIVPARNATVAMGDSITDFGGAYDYLPWLGSTYMNQLHNLTRQRMRYGGTYAAGGWHMTQIRDFYLPQVLALSPRPGAAVLFLGTNDGANYIYQNQHTLRDIIRQLLAVGIAPILTTILPRDDSPASTPRQMTWNSWIKKYAALNGYSVIDAWEACTDPDDTYKAGYSTDGMHPTPLGYKAIADRAIADGVPNIFPATPTGLTSTSATDATNMFHDGTTNRGLFVTDTNADGVADGFTKSATGLFSLVTPSGGDALAGKWQQIQHSTTGQPVYIQRVLTGWTTGQPYRFSCRVQTQNFFTTGATFTLDVEAAVPGGFITPTGTSITNVINGIINWTADTEGLLYVDFTVPTGTTALVFYAWINAITSGNPILRVGEVTFSAAPVGGGILSLTDDGAGEFIIGTSGNASLTEVGSTGEFLVGTSGATTLTEDGSTGEFVVGTSSGTLSLTDDGSGEFAIGTSGNASLTEDGSTGEFIVGTSGATTLTEDGSTGEFLKG